MFDHRADTEDHLLQHRGAKKYSIYVKDCGSPAGFRLATLHSEPIQAIITRNGNAYGDGLAPFWAELPLNYTSVIPYLWSRWSPMS